MCIIISRLPFLSVYFRHGFVLFHALYLTNICSPSPTFFCGAIPGTTFLLRAKLLFLTPHSYIALSLFS